MLVIYIIERMVFMKKSKIITLVLSLVAGIATLLATTSANACYPFLFHQPKAPKSLIKAD